MSIAFKWSVNKIQVIPAQEGKTNIVTNVEWAVTATDNVNNLTASASGTRHLTLGDSFVNFDNLNEQQVLDWCFAPEVVTWVDLDNTTKTSTRLLKNEGETQVTEQIKRQLAQKETEPALPWA